MKIRNLVRALSLQIGVASLLLAGCHSARQPGPAGESANPDSPRWKEEAQAVADAALGKQAEIISRGDLARNGLQQLLVVNRVTKATKTNAGPGNSSAIFITRAVILEKSNGKWTEILRCDEHLKNPNGYLGGAPAARTTGWQLQYRTDARHGLELQFTPADGKVGGEGTGEGGLGGQTVVVRWNAGAKRYQSLDSSHEGYLSEAPTLETPHSILR
jgi:hypothetical protein